jgi:Fic family protein
MKSSDFTEHRFGHLVATIAGQMAFVPDNLPPRVQWTPELVTVLSDANQAIGQLQGVGFQLPNPSLLITPFIRREAEMSSRIEGTQASIEQLYLFEVEERRIESKVPDVREVYNYTRALEYGLKRSQELPVCLRMICELHEILLKDVRGQQRAPGQFRKVQNWIGTQRCPIEQARYVPPPLEQMTAALDAFEKFINSPLENLPVLVWLAMVHYQFEAIHPFIDGNGRIGRLLITLLLCVKKVLDKPLLYISGYFERNRQQYYDRLLEVSTHGRWTEWIFFFLRGVIEQSKDAFERARQLMDLQQKFRKRVHSAKRSALQIRLIDLLIERPVITIRYVSKYFDVTYTTAKNNISKLVKVGILTEATGARRNRVYIAREVLKIITEPSVIGNW